MPEFLQVVLVIVIVGALIYVSHLRAKARRRELAGLASDLGWRFDPSGDAGHEAAYGHFSIFDRGRSRRAYNSLFGTIAIDGRTYATKAGDFRFTTGSGKNRKTHTFSYLLLNLPFRSTPELHIRREHVFDKVASAIGFDDIDFESEEFSRRFYVKSPDKKFAYDVVHARMMEFLLSGRGPALELKGGACCFWDGTDTKWKPSQFRKRIWWAQEFFNLWPDYLTSQLDT
jgi:hypothetical protein